MIISWVSSLDTGIDIIDEQHTRSVDYLNHRHIAVATKDTSGVAAAPDQLTHYTVSHFAFEEGLMESHGDQHAVAHSKVPAMFSDRVTTYDQEWVGARTCHVCY